MFQVRFDGAQDSPVYVPIGRSKSKHGYSNPHFYFPHKRKRRIPSGDVYIGRRPGPSPFKRLKGKERLTWYEWLWDWRTALHKQGFVCRNDLVNSLRTNVTDGGLRKPECICLQQGETTLFLYSSVQAIPKGQAGTHGPLVDVYHIVRGRRPDSARGVKRLADGAAIGILPNGEMTGLPHILVEFDDGLFELKDGIWKETNNERVTYLYQIYRANSSHYVKIRPRCKLGAKQTFLPKHEIRENLDFSHYESN